VEHVTKTGELKIVKECSYTRNGRGFKVIFAEIRRKDGSQCHYLPFSACGRTYFGIKGLDRNGI